MDTQSLRNAIDEARNVMDSADTLARRAAPMLAGRLRRIGICHDVLKALKRELQDFDAGKMRWKRR